MLPSFPPMHWLPPRVRTLGCALLSLLLLPGPLSADSAGGSRFDYLEESGPFYPNGDFPRLITPQWIGEPGVDAVIHLTVDGISQVKSLPDHALTPAACLDFLEPAIRYLTAIDGRAPITLYALRVHPRDPTLKRLADAGIATESHTFTHPVPLLQTDKSGPLGIGTLMKARGDFMGSLANLAAVPRINPSAFRAPAFDSRNVVSPRLFTDLLSARLPSGRYLSLDSSVTTWLTSADSDLGNRSVRYLANIPGCSRYVNVIRDYPYPYVVDGIFWELPVVVPTPAQVGDPTALLQGWHDALAEVVKRKGLCTIALRGDSNLTGEMLASWIDQAHRTYGNRVKFLNSQEIHDRLSDNLLGGQRLRNQLGADNGVRLADLNQDGLLDVLIGNNSPKSRVWNTADNTWIERPLPVALVAGSGLRPQPSGAQLYTVSPSGTAGISIATPEQRGTFHFVEGRWYASAVGLPEIADGSALHTRADGRDRGVRFRDLNGDGCSDLIVNNERQNAIFLWEPDKIRWRKATFALPRAGLIVDARGNDRGLRFVDLDADGHLDLLYSNEDEFAAWLFNDLETGWSDTLLSGKRDSSSLLPAITWQGRNTGAWLSTDALLQVNELTASEPDYLIRVPFARLLEGRSRTVATD